MKIEIILGNLLEQEVDAIVNPAHASGYMGYGAAKAIVKHGGKEIESSAVDQAPLIVGDAIGTTAGKLPFKEIIHTATFEDSNLKIEKGTISKALLGALLYADEKGYKSIAIPGMGTGIGGVNYHDSAVAMSDPLRKFVPHSLEKIILVDLNEDMVKAWKKALN